MRSSPLPGWRRRRSTEEGLARSIACIPCLSLCVISWPGTDCSSERLQRRDQRLHCKQFLMLCPRNAMANSFLFPLSLPLPPPAQRRRDLREGRGSPGHGKIFLPPRGAHAAQALALRERSRCALMGEDGACLGSYDSITFLNLKSTT